ncbi:MAG: bifunctional 3,4-dihydroxy-2-butanone-4-phosphate synthase/GTP cyclohydrolase II [Dehalococcoidia bacterium]|nr:bifunctional 3,4-dihydroxy-2-butanone-4-phosphate synthase/GTP cyclohydrolase II [Dehalococcoidia bacterium]
MSLSPVPEIIEDIKTGKFVIIVDDENRENEGDLAIAAEKISAEAINFMATHARGLICLPIISRRLDELQIPPMVQENTSKFTTAFAVSIEAKNRTTSGISAYDRSATVKAVIDSKTKAEDIARPGHMFPLRAREGGVLVRAGHTEAIVDLARMAGLYPAGVICEILNPDGTMARLPQLESIAEKFSIKIVSIADLITYRRKNERLVQKVAEAKFPTIYGDFTIMAYKSTVDADEHIALIKGDLTVSKPTLVRVHSECVTGDVFGSLRCDCGEQVRKAMAMIAEEERGVFLYMRQEGRGIGIHNKLKAYELQDKGLDTVEANLALGFEPDLRDYGIGAQILADLGLHEIRLLTNNPKKIIGLESYGLKVLESVRLLTEPTEYNKSYLKTKQEKMGHLLAIDE